MVRVHLSRALIDILYNIRHTSNRPRLFTLKHALCQSRCAIFRPILSGTSPPPYMQRNQRNLTVSKVLNCPNTKRFDKFSKKIRKEDAEQNDHNGSPKLKESLITELLLEDNLRRGDGNSETTSFDLSIGQDKLAEAFENILDEEDTCSDSTLNLSDHENDLDLSLADEGPADPEIDYIEELQIDHHDFLQDKPRGKGQSNQYRGTPDPNEPISKTPCHGCGALLHCQDPGIPGYMPSQNFLHIKKDRLREYVCQRCFFMKEYDMALDASVPPEEYKQIIEKIKYIRALVIVVVDVTDMPNSIFPGLSELIGERRPLYIVGNKADLLPRDGPGYLQRTRDMLMQLCKESGLATDKNIKHVSLISAKTGYGIEDLVTRLMADWSRKGHIFILGCTNVGKSTLFNSLLMSDYCKETARDYIKRATTSVWPGTTLNLLKFPIIRPEPWKLIQRSKRLKQQTSEEKEEYKMRLAAYRESHGLQNITLIGRIGQTFESYTNIAVNEEDSMGFSGASFSYNAFKDVNEPKKYDRHAMMGHKYDESTYEKSRWCYDTPGVVNAEQIINLLTQHELSVMLSNKIIMPRSFIIKPGQSMLVSGLSRIDYAEGERPVYFTIFAAEQIPIKVRDTKDIDDFYLRHLGTSVLGIPIGGSERLAKLPQLIGQDMLVTGISLRESAADILLSSIGWAAVTPGPGLDARLRVYTPGGLGSGLRKPALLPYAINLRGKRSRPGRGKKIRPASYQVKPLPSF